MIVVPSRVTTLKKRFAGMISAPGSTSDRCNRRTPLRADAGEIRTDARAPLAGPVTGGALFLSFEDGFSIRDVAGLRGERCGCKK